MVYVHLTITACDITICIPILVGTQDMMKGFKCSLAIRVNYSYALLVNSEKPIIQTRL